MEKDSALITPINATLLAKYIIQRTNTNSRYITHLQLQKILYYAQGTFAAIFDRHLFAEDIEAWYYGPVVRQVYDAFLFAGAAPLYDTPKRNNITICLSNHEREIVDSVIDTKSAMSARELVNATRREAPWKAYEAQVSSKPVIPFEAIKDYFQKILRISARTV